MRATDLRTTAETIARKWRRMLLPVSAGTNGAADDASGKIRPLNADPSVFHLSGCTNMHDGGTTSLLGKLDEIAVTAQPTSREDGPTY